MIEKRITDEQFFLIARELEMYHAVFSKIWNLGKPIFDDKIETARVLFDNEGNCFSFQFNPNFWDKCLEYERYFIICHECLHVLLNHGSRLKFLDKNIGNIAADIVINELLVSSFNFDRTRLGWIGKNGCWINTIFPEQTNDILKDKSLEYYYNILQKDSSGKNENSLKNGTVMVLDNHDGLENISESGEILEEILESLNEIEKSSLNKSLREGNRDEISKCEKQAGTFPGNLYIKVSVGNVKVKRKWETVIKKWANRFIHDADKDLDQWARTNRRFVGVMNDLFLPSEMEIEERDCIQRKIKVIFFQDTSGSCSHLAERFFKAAKSLPKDRFDIELYCFDTQCYSTTLESGNLYGFGGTSFSILEDKVLEICKNDLTKYAKAVFVITDGYGNNIYPKKPKNWYWFLSGKYKYYIPEECNVFDLSDFE